MPMMLRGDTGKALGLGLGLASARGAQAVSGADSVCSWI